MHDQEAVYIVGLGARTAVGVTASMTAASVRAGIVRVGEHPYMIGLDGEPMLVARAAYLDDDAAGSTRFAALAEPALEEALAPLEATDGETPAMPLLIGLPDARPGRPADLEGDLGDLFSRGERWLQRFQAVVSIAGGHAAGLMALQEGCRRIQNGSASFCLVGGIDSYLEPETLEWLDAEEQLHSTTTRWGFSPGEAAGFCLLASGRTAERYGLGVYGAVLAAGTAHERHGRHNGTVCVGDGLTQAFGEALQGLAPRQRVDHVICDMNGERHRADEYGFASLRLGAHFADATAFAAPASYWGDVGAASGPLFVSLALMAGLRGYAPGPRTLVWASSEGGARSAVLLQAAVPQR